MGQAVVHFEIVGKDGQKLQGFYSELFGWQIDANNPMGYGMVAREGNGIAGGVSGSMPGNEGYGGHVTVYVEVPDVEEALSRAESLGGKRLMGPDQVPEGPVIGQFTDPEGHLIGVLQG